MPRPSSAPPASLPDALREASAALARGEAQRARQCYAQAIAEHPAAQVELGRMLALGIGGPVDLPAAWDHWLAAEQRGHPAAAYLLATYAEADDAQALARLRAAADAGLPVAQRGWALMRAHQDDPQAADEALALLRVAAGRDPIAALLLAARAAGGEGMPADPALAASLHRQLADHGLPALPAVTPDAPTPLRVLHDAPWIAVADGVLSADECRLLVALMRPHLRRSQVFGDGADGRHVQAVRTSRSATVDRVIEDHAARRIQQRLAAVAGMPLRHAEAMSILCYAPGQEYRPHRDYLPPAALREDRPDAGNRRRTLCVYLNDVQAGGETAFPVAGVKVSPRAGRVVVFDNLDARGHPLPDSLHAGLPVVRGEKWLGTLWLRERPYREI